MHPARRLTLLAANGLAFQLLYGAAAASAMAAAARGAMPPSVTTPWDALLPWWPAMLLPYMSSVPLLALAFLTVPNEAGLRALSQRCLAATTLACLAFVLWPMQVALPRPPAAASGVPLAWLQALLDFLDSPYNQCPSLHAAFCVILWPALRARLRSPLAQVALAAWLVLVAASTVLTRQHQLIDLPAGLALGALLCAVLPVHGDRARVALHHALLALAALTLALAWRHAAQGVPSVLLGWVAVSSLGVAHAYLRGDAHFLRKRAGGFAWWIWLLHAPYLLGYRLCWLTVRLTDRAPAWQAVTPGLLAGRRLTDAEAAALPADCAVVDLSAELPGTPALRGAPTTQVPLLDIVAPTAAQLQAAVDAIAQHRRAGRPVYLHCAMGWRRTQQVLQAWQAALAENAALDHAEPPAHR